MKTEVERKFLVNAKICPPLVNGIKYIQGYITNTNNKVIRIRIAGSGAFITIKARINNNACENLEYEYPIPLEDAKTLLEKVCRKPLIEKTRYTLNYAEKEWTIDLFHSVNKGLLLAEIELNTPDEDFEVPPWITEEVTGNPMYYNCNMIN